MQRRRFLALAGGLALPALAAAAVGGPARRAGAESAILDVYRTPWCGCCGAWVEHMRAAGFTVRVTEMEDLAPLKQRLAVPPALQACHTGVIDGYVVEGHVPAPDVARLLQARPDAVGLSVPGMPVGSPGMETGAPPDAFDTILFSAGGETVFASH